MMNLFFEPEPTRPEKKPPVKGAQGVSKGPCETSWPGAKSKTMVSPTAAVVVSGLKTSPVLPTSIVCVAAAAKPTRARAPRRLLFSCILASETKF